MIRAIFQGGFDKLREAGVSLLGGHTVQDPEIKFGYAVTGAIDPTRVLTERRRDAPATSCSSRKPLGTGIVGTAIKFDRVDAGAGRRGDLHSMRTLNQRRGRTLQTLPAGAVHACTDVTGFRPDIGPRRPRWRAASERDGRTNRRGRRCRSFDGRPGRAGAAATRSWAASAPTWSISAAEMLRVPAGCSDAGPRPALAHDPQTSRRAPLIAWPGTARRDQADAGHARCRRPRWRVSAARRGQRGPISRILVRP